MLIFSRRNHRDVAQIGISYAVLLAVLLHGWLIFGISFTMPTPHPQLFAPQYQPLHVTVAHAPPAPEPQIPHAPLLASTAAPDTDKRANVVPLPVHGKSLSLPARTALHATAAVPTPPSTPRSATTALLKAQRPAPAIPHPAPRPEKKSVMVSPPAPFSLRAASPAPKTVNTAALLASMDTEIAQLTTELERKSDAYAQRPRRKAVSANATEYKYAAYMEDWRRKVERIGNLNYPDEARRKHLFGDLVLQVGVRSDGEIERIRVLHSSGYPVLDEAAQRIVRMAAPFAPFPPDIRKEIDVLDITRTWQFLNNNQLGWK